MGKMRHNYFENQNHRRYILASNRVLSESAVKLRPSGRRYQA